MVLQDVLKKGLSIVFCGTAAGNKSAELAQYYAGPGNKFYPILAEIGLTPRRLDPSEFKTLPEYGIGLTDLVKMASGNDNVLKSAHFDVQSFTEKILSYQPKVLCFNGKKAASVFFGLRKTSSISFGFQHSKTIGNTKIFVAPSTSGAANGYWDKEVWQQLPKLLNGLKG
jgi:TDG/mug DNA glycosylase family protein